MNAFEGMEIDMEVCTCTSDPCDPDCLPCSIEAHTPERPPTFPWQQDLRQLSRESLEEVRAAYRAQRNSILTEEHSPYTDRLLLLFDLHSEDLPSYEELHPTPRKSPPVNSDRLTGKTVVNGITITNADRTLVWSYLGDWDESLPAEERARIEAEFPDEAIAEIVASGLL